jgi:hypothetical protein
MAIWLYLYQEVTMAADDYAPPVDRLLTYGTAKLVPAGDWPDYIQEFGLTTEHIPDLIHLATDRDLNEGAGDGPELWGPIHAWRALGQLRAGAAIEPLLSLFDMENDWVTEEIPDVYGRLGSAAIPSLTAYLEDPNRDKWGRFTAANCLVKIGQQHPDARSECVAILTRQLAVSPDAAGTDADAADAADVAEFNGFLVDDLINLKAVEALPAIEQVFAADVVDESITGDWGDVQVALGVKTYADLGREPPAYPERSRVSSESTRSLHSAPGSRSTPEKAKEKSKRKMAKDSRKKNKKRK